MLHVVSAIALAATVATAKVDSGEMRREDLMAALRTGGYTVILRHARTDRSFQEQIATVPEKRSEQRNLSDDGFRDAALMGVVFRKYGITFSEIIASPMYRATETADMAAGKATTTMALRVIPSTPEQEALIKAAPKKGTNRLLVTHHFVIETHVPGIKPGDIGESEAAVVRRTADGKVELAGRITLDDWQALANPNHGVTRPAAPALPTAPASHGAYTPAPHVTEFPDTPVGHQAKNYIAAFNSGSADNMRAFIESAMIADPARPTEDRLKSYAKLFEAHGPLSLVKVDSSAAIATVLAMKSRVGDVKVTVKSSESSPMRVSSVTFAYGQPGGHR